MRPLRSLLAATVLVAVGLTPALAQTVAPTPHPPRRQGLTPIPAQPDCAQPYFTYPGGPWPGSLPPTDPKSVDPKGVDPLATPPSITDPAGQGATPPAPGPDTAASAGVGFNPAMFGDIIGGPATTPVRISPTSVARLPQLTRGSYKIADNASPRPTDRIYINFNYFNNVNTFSSGVQDINYTREIFAIEKTFLSGNASVELRLPFIQLENAGQVNDQFLGDLSVILKYALINDRATGNLLSTGLVVTAPTGENFTTVTGESIHSTVIQPFVGYVYNFNNCFVQGFSSLVVPTDSRDAVILFTDIGVGYWLYRTPDPNNTIKGIVPTLEAHLGTPLSQRGSQNTPVGIPDWLTILAGVNFIFDGNTTLGFACGTPVTGPRPYDYEATVSLNIRF